MNRTMTRTAAAFAAAILLLLCCAGAAAEKTVLMTFTGDCTLGIDEKTRKPQADPNAFDGYAEKYGYNYFFSNFRDMFANDDLTIINFEGVLSDSNLQKKPKKTYCFRGPTDYVRMLTGNSIEGAGLANNHIGDFGKQGEESTKKTLEENGVPWFQNFKYHVFEKDGVKIAVFAMENKVVYNEFDKLKKTMKNLKDSGEANAIVICWHTGLEYRGGHETNTERTAQALTKYGADLVIMHHPHVLQGVNITNNRCIFYSLGNFVFGGNNKIREEKYLIDKTVSSLYSMVVQVRMTFSNEGRYLGQQATIYPIYTSSAAPANNFQPYRVNAEEAVPVREALQQDTPFELPPITTDDDGLSKIEITYLPAFDGVMVPEGEGDSTDGPQGVPEAASPAPTRNTKGK